MRFAAWLCHEQQHKIDPVGIFIVSTRRAVCGICPLDAGGICVGFNPNGMDIYPNLSNGQNE